MSLALVVDDSRSARAILARQLERHEVEVVAVDTGEAALEFLQDRHADVIFMDHLLPGIDGFDALRAIKDNPRTARIPVLMYTSKRGEVYLSQVRALGAAGVLRKGNRPVQVSKVLKTLKLGDEAGQRDPWKLETVISISDGHAEEEPIEAEDMAAPATDDGPQTAVAGDDNAVAGPAAVSHAQDRADADPSPELHEVDDQDMTDLHGSLGRLEDKIGVVSQQLVAERELAAEPVLPGDPVDRRWRWAALGLAGLAVVLLLQWSGARDQLGLLRGQVVAQGREISNLRDNIDRDLSRLNERLASGSRAGEGSTDPETIEWALNLDRWVGPTDVPLNDVRLAKLEGLVKRLESADFQGVIRLNVHSGDFCLNRAGDGFAPARQGITVNDCDVLGNPIAERRRIQSPDFTKYLADNAILSVGRIRVEVVNYSNTSPLMAYPNDAGQMDAVKWNGIAALNNRVEFELIPD